VEVTDGLHRITNRRLAMQHRLNIGTIVSDAMLKVKMMSGGYVGMIEEYFISRLKPGDIFSLAGRNLEFVMIKEMTVLVRKSNSKKAIVPSWNGGRMPLSANLGSMLRKKLDDASHFSSSDSEELLAIRPVLELQRNLSALPKKDELLVEMIDSKYGYHLFIYPFEGRLVHEALAALLAYRISRRSPISFSFAMNDYGFELISDSPIPVNEQNIRDFFSEENLLSDIHAGVNATEMARRKFRDIAVISGLIFQGMPGKYQKPRHLQSSASLLFDVFSEYDPGNPLVRQAYGEVMEQQMDEARLRDLLRRINNSKIIITRPPQFTPFCFPVLVDSMRESLSSEKLEDRVRKMVEEIKK
jgi:ATP-dependent Lhr-like helicase